MARRGRRWSCRSPEPRLTVCGLPWFEENKQRLSRLPVRLKDRFRAPVWALAQQTSGVRIRFRTNSRSVGIVGRVAGDSPFT